MVNIKKSELMRFFFYFIVSIYGIIIVVGANFGVIDDHNLLDTLLIGKKLPLFIFPEIGRFYPLDGFEYNLISLISVSPYAFYLYNLIQFIILIFILQKLLLEILGFRYKNIIFLSILILILSPGFVTAWFRLFVPERSVLFFLIIFLYFYVLYQKEQKISYFVLGLISANIALYYKEPVFLMLGSFAFFHLVFGWKEINSKQRICDYALIASSVIFVAIYFFVVFLHKGNNLYGATNVNYLLQLLKNLFSYALCDPLIVFLLLPLAFWRLYRIIKTKSSDVLYDSLLFSSFIYMLVFLKLNLPFSYHYLLPVYSFGMFAILHYIFNLQIYKKLFFNFVLLVAFLSVLFSSLPTGLHLISHYKNVPNNFQNTLTFLSKYINKESKNGKKVSIFLDGVNRNTGVEVYHSFIKYLEFRGLDSSLFDIKSDEDDNGILKLQLTDPTSKYTIWRQTKASQIEKGDLVIITPYTTKYIGLSKKEIEEKFSEYELLYHADSILEIPNLGIKAVIKGVFAKISPPQEGVDKKMISRNIYNLPLDFYVLLKK